MNELQALKNAVESANTIGLSVNEWLTNDKRKTAKRYFLQLGPTSISPVLDYEQMNCFLLGFIKAKNL